MAPARPLLMWRDMLTRQLVPILASFVLTTACKRADGHPRHDHVSSSAMWRVHLDELSVQAHDKPGLSKAITLGASSLQVGCRLAADPGNESITTWIQSTIDSTGHVQFTHATDPSVAKDITHCAQEAVANTKLAIPEGEYRLTVKVWFSDPQP